MLFYVTSLSPHGRIVTKRIWLGRGPEDSMDRQGERESNWLGTYTCCIKQNLPILYTITVLFFILFSIVSLDFASKPFKNNFHSHNWFDFLINQISLQIRFSKRDTGICLSEDDKSVKRSVNCLKWWLCHCSHHVITDSTCPYLLSCKSHDSRHRRCTVPDRESGRRSRNPAIATALELIVALQPSCLLDGGKSKSCGEEKKSNSDALKL